MICEVQGRVEGLGGGSLSGPICCAGRSLGRDDGDDKSAMCSGSSPSKQKRKKRKVYVLRSTPAKGRTVPVPVHDCTS